LFSGAGGLTFGFYYCIKDGEFVRNCDNQFVFANEYDRLAANAFCANYPDIQMLNCDIKTISREQVVELIGDEAVDIIIGGPPCQSFSTIGKRRFDDKAKLYTEYIRLLAIVKPKMFLFENVKGMLSMREQLPEMDIYGNEVLDEKGNVKTKSGKKILDVIKEKFSSITEQLGYSLVGEDVLDAADYGVPQHRERVFLVGVRNDLIDKIHWTYPSPTFGQGRIPYRTIKEAIDDFPSLCEGERKEHYDKAAENDYQILMRGNNHVLTNHDCRTHNQKIRTIIENVPQGEGRYYINKLVDEKKIPEYCRLTSGYRNTYGRLVENKPSTTITNNMCTPSALRCIHYSQNRELTPREGARIQSFPDWYVFCGEKANVTTQIGNAVPPLLALSIARRIEEVLRGI